MSHSLDRARLACTSRDLCLNLSSLKFNTVQEYILLYIFVALDDGDLVTEVGGTQAVHFQWKESKMTCKTPPYLCERAQSLRKKAAVNKESFLCL